MSTILRIALSCCLASLAVMTAHCSTSDPGPAEAPVDAGSGEGSARPDPQDSADCPKHCSDDLTTVLDCNGGIVESCTGTKGCGDGTCVSACDSSRLNRSNAGCEFIVPRAPTLDPTSCHALFVTNGWRSPATLKVSRNGETFSLAGRAIHAADERLVDSDTIAPGETIIVGLAGSYCKGEPLIVEPHKYKRDVGLNESGRTRAFEIESDVPVQIHDTDALVGTEGGGFKSLALLSASTTWEEEYIVAMPTPDESYGGFIQVVAREDSVIELRPREAILGSPDLPGVQPTEARSYKLARGEVLQFVQPSDLTGSFLVANKPVGLFAGAVNFVVDGPINGSTHVQVAPARSLGDRYAAIRYRDRYANKPEKGIWRVVGAADGTTLAYDPAPPAGAPTRLDAGEFVEFKADRPFVVASQDAAHPFALYAYMTSPFPYMDSSDQSWAGDVRGAPEFTSAVSVAQYMKRYRFYTDPFFPETNVIVVRRRGDAGFADVILDCAGPLSGWSALGGTGDLEFTNFDLSKGNYETQGNCKNGIHEMHSDAPFTATVWGWGSAATGGASDPGVFTRGNSYGFPIGAGFRPVNTIKLPGDIR